MLSSSEEIVLVFNFVIEWKAKLFITMTTSIIMPYPMSNLLSQNKKKFLTLSLKARPDMIYPDDIISVLNNAIMNSFRVYLKPLS